MHVIHALPGRVRWHVPLLLDRPPLAEAVRRRLLATSGVLAAKADALTGNVLLQFSSALTVDEAGTILGHAVDAAIASPTLPVRLPAQQSTETAPMMRLIERARVHDPLARKLVVTSFFNRLLDSSPPLLISSGIDIVSRGRSSLVAWMGFKSVTSQLLGLGGLGLALWAVDSMFDYAHKTTAAELANRVRHDLRNDLYAQLQRLDLAQVETREVGEWMALIDGDLARIHSFIKEGGDPLITILANGIAMTGASLSLSPGFALAQLAVIPPVAIVSQQMFGPMKDRLVVAYRDSDRLSKLLHGNVSSLAAINSFGTQDLEAQRVADAGEDQLVTARQADQFQAMYVPTLTMIAGTGFMATLVYGGLQVEKGLLAPGALNLLATTQIRMLSAIGHLGSSLQNMQRTSVSLERVFAILDMKPELVDREDAVPITGVSRDIVFDHVSFGYGPDRLALRDVSLRLPAGATVGIVGSSGAGKSTILKLLSRFYDVRSGAIRYDDVDIRDLRSADLHHAIAMVAQEVAIFSGTVRENIAYARPEATDDEIRMAAEIAQAHDFVSSLPNGYETHVGLGGLSLSAGQRQRLAIARVVLADRPVVLFDEATSALDYKTEAAVQTALRDATAGRTTVIVAHRLSTVRSADLIYVLDEGRVCESGTHDELIQSDGVYAAMWKVQTGEHARPRNGHANGH